MAEHDHIGKKTYFFHVGNRFSYPMPKKRMKLWTFIRMYSLLAGESENHLNVWGFLNEDFFSPLPKKTNTLPETAQK